MTIKQAKRCAAQCGFNTVRLLKEGASFYAHQPCLFVAKDKDAKRLAFRLFENMQLAGWHVMEWHWGVKPNPSFARWSSIWVRMRAEPAATK